jgi:hypothetical protein
MAHWVYDMTHYFSEWPIEILRKGRDSRFSHLCFFDGIFQVIIADNLSVNTVKYYKNNYYLYKLFKVVV